MDKTDQQAPLSDLDNTGEGKVKCVVIRKNRKQVAIKETKVVMR